MDWGTPDLCNGLLRENNTVGGGLPTGDGLQGLSAFIHRMLGNPASTTTLYMYSSSHCG